MKAADRRVKGLGEVAVRVQDLDTMHKFYEEVVGLQVLRREDAFVFFKVAEGYGGHAQVIALFEASRLGFIEEKSPHITPEASTLHHIALNIDLQDLEAEKVRLEGLGLKVEEADHPWIHVRSLYFSDPEGNLLEFVCFDDSLE